jgi:putative transposase
MIIPIPWPSNGFATIDAAREWVKEFTNWYNEEHRHSKIRFVTPADRHRGEDREILARREQIYARAKAKKPSRWSGKIRNWTPIGAVALNPERIEHQKAEAA